MMKVIPETHRATSIIYIYATHVHGDRTPLF